MRELPILFKKEMRVAILAGRKTVTRRVKCHYEAGDILWVKDRLFMPKIETQIWLLVTNVSQGPLSDVHDAEAMLEGAPDGLTIPTAWWYRKLWEKINKSYDPSLLVWRIEFSVIKKPIHGTK